MLMVTRNTMEGILLPDLGIQIVVTHIGRSRVRLALEVPRRHKVISAELAHPEEWEVFKRVMAASRAEELAPVAVISQQSPAPAEGGTP